MVAAMEKRKEIRELRDRMDRTLALPDLADEGLLRSLVKKQILASSLSGSDEGDINLIAEARSREISNFLEMLNTSENERSLKIHEAQHKEWKVKQDTDQLRVMYREGPEGTPFHTLLAEGFADGPIDVPWPVSEREALLHYFELEYLKEDLVIVIMKTISDTDNINIQTHGFSRDGIPEAGDTIRIDVVGGFVLQRITKERSFFSTVASCDEDYKKALREPLYVRIREHQASTDMAKVAPMEESAMEANPDNLTLQNLLAATSITSSSEIVEEESEHKVLFKLDHLAAGPSNHPAGQQQLVENKPYISPEVEQALSILDKAIGVVRGKSVGSASAVQKFLSYDTTLDGRTTDSRNSHNLPNGLPAMLPPQDSRETRQANSLPNEKANHREEDALDSDSNRYTTASTVTKTLSMTIRSTTRVHGEESLDTNGLHQNGFHKDKESKRSRKRKTNRWFCCLTPSTTG
uniref:Uncharacterized protein n=1 Tax=Leersia perrieri TaxID=77586 RepID=A0A0D9XTA7_9ORYZ